MNIIRIATVVIALLLGGCGRSSWAAIGYADRLEPTREIPLGHYSSEDEARAAGIAFTKTNPAGDYIICQVSSSGTLQNKRR